METLKHLNVEFQKLSLRMDIQSKVESDISKQQREYFLQQQMKTIQEELGGNSYEAEIEEMRARAKTKKWNEDVAKHFDRELSKLQRMNPQVAEFSIQRNYLDLLLELPWNDYSVDKFDLKRARKILDRDHYGLDDVKQRIIWLVKRTLMREPSQTELSILVEGYDEQLVHYRAEPESAKSLIATGTSKPDETLDPAELAAWTMTASTLINLDEYINKP